MKSQTVIILIHHGSSIISLLLHIKIISAEALGSGNIIFHLSYYRKNPQTYGLSQLDSRSEVKFIRFPFSKTNVSDYYDMNSSQSVRIPNTFNLFHLQ